MSVQDDEREHRLKIWQAIREAGADNASPSTLHKLGAYGGAQGIWVDKKRTGPVAPDGFGVTVGLLHTGRHYPDDISDDGLIYHYPKTGRGPSRDAAEVAATKNAASLKLPVFVVLPGETTQSRKVRLGWVEDWDDEAKLFLILFGEVRPTYEPPIDQDEPFSLTDETPPKKAMANVRTRQQVFRFQVLQRYGSKCAVCSITHPSLIKAAHIREKRDKGSDDWRNGLPLCSTHHDAYDAHMFAIDPDTLTIITAPKISAASIGLSTNFTKLNDRRPHPDALAWRLGLSQSKWRVKGD